MSHSSEPRDPHTPRDESDLGFDLPSPAKVSRTRTATLVLAGVSVLIAAFLFGWLPKRQARQELEANSKSEGTAVQRVDVVMPKVLSSDRSLVLSGSIRPLEEAVIRPRANGYVRERFVDLGDKVAAGAPLVQIDTPELDQQLQQARAQVAQATAALTHAKATRDFAKASLHRHEKLAPSGVTSQEEFEKSRAEAAVAEASVAVAQANLDAQGANVHRLMEEKSFGRVTAPFAGTIVSRTINKGALVSPASELFKLATVDPILVQIDVPQDVAPSIKAGVPASVTVREYAGRKFEGKVAHFAGALDAQTRTMATLVEVPNREGALLSGMYAQVELTLSTPHKILEVPATALISDAQGTRIAVVTAENKLHLARIAIERDTGPTLHIATGISESDRIVRIANASLVEGATVELATPAAAPANH